MLKNKAIYLSFALIFIVLSSAATADERVPWTVQASLYNVHYRSSSEHLRYSPLLALEYQREDRWLAGAALFRNSFGQFSQLAYVGQRYFFADSGFYGKWVAGVLHGYRGRYQNKVPYNYRGFSPAVLPGIGYRYKSWQLETQFFWTNGLMLMAGFNGF